MFRKVFKILLFTIFIFISLASPKDSYAFPGDCLFKDVGDCLPGPVKDCLFKDIKYCIPGPVKYCLIEDVAGCIPGPVKYCLIEDVAGCIPGPVKYCLIEDVAGCIPGNGKPNVDCTGLTPQGKTVCESQNSQCFWYGGGYNQGAQCVRNNGKMNWDIPCNGGYCYLPSSGEMTQQCQQGQYCSTVDQGGVNEHGGATQTCSEQGGVVNSISTVCPNGSFIYATDTNATKTPVCCTNIGGSGPIGAPVPIVPGHDDPTPPKSAITCSPPDHKCATEANRPDGYSYVDSELNRKALDTACGGGLNYCWTRIGTGSGGTGTNPGNPVNPSCAGINLYPSGNFDSTAAEKCASTSLCFISGGTYFEQAKCVSGTPGPQCGKMGSAQSYCISTQSCTVNSQGSVCVNNGTIQPGTSGGNSCKNFATGLPNPTVCSSGICNPDLTCKPPTPVIGKPNSANPCEGHGTQSYVNSVCGDGKTTNELFNAGHAAAGQYCNALYFDRVACSDGTTVDVPVPTSDSVCANSWTPAGVCAQTGGGTAKCEDASGNPKVCAANETCTLDYNYFTTHKDQGHCCQDGKRYCDNAGTCVPASQGCGVDPTKLGLNYACKGATDTSCDTSANLVCTDVAGTGHFTCQYKKDANNNPILFTPTPQTGGNCNYFGSYGIGCPCLNGGGCGYDPATGGGLACMPAFNPSGSGDNYCVPGGNAWCKSSQRVEQHAASCPAGSAPTATPAPETLSWQQDCQQGGGRACLPGTCESQPGWQQSPASGVGGTNGNLACSYSSPDAPGYNTSHATGWSCCIPKPTNTGGSTGGSTGGTGSTGGGSTTCDSPNQCQAGPTGAEFYTCTGGWSPIGNRNCAINTVCCKKD